MGRDHVEYDCTKHSCILCLFSSVYFSLRVKAKLIKATAFTFGQSEPQISVQVMHNISKSLAKLISLDSAESDVDLASAPFVSSIFKQ